MPVEKLTFRLEPRDLNRPEDGTFQTHYEARVGRPLNDLDLNEVFQNVGQERLEPGDQVTFCAFAGSLTARDRVLREVREARIVAKVKEGSRSRIKAVWVGPTFKVPEETLAPEKEGTYKLEIVPEFEGDFTVRDAKGNVLERVGSKAEADAFVDSYVGKVEKRKPGRPPKAEKPPEKATAA